jgi:hypothetical protein
MNIREALVGDNKKESLLRAVQGVVLACVVALIWVVEAEGERKCGMDLNTLFPFEAWGD